MTYTRRPKGYYRTLIALLAVPGGVIMLIAAWIESARAASDETNGTIALWLAILGILMIVVPIVCVVAAGAIESSRRYFAWRRTLTPEQRLALDLAAVTAMTAAHVAWSRHNQEVSERLSASAMGDAPLNPAHAGMMRMNEALNASVGQG